MSHEQMLRHKPDGVPYIPMYLPAVEAWYKDVVPVSAFREFLAFKRRTDMYFERFNVDGALERLEELNRHWESEEERLKQELRARGELDLADLIEERQSDR